MWMISICLPNKLEKENFVLVFVRIINFDLGESVLLIWSVFPVVRKCVSFMPIKSVK